MVLKMYVCHSHSNIVWNGVHLPVMLVHVQTTYIVHVRIYIVCTMYKYMYVEPKKF